MGQKLLWIIILTLFLVGCNDQSYSLNELNETHQLSGLVESDAISNVSTFNSSSRTINESVIIEENASIKSLGNKSLDLNISDEEIVDEQDEIIYIGSVDLDELFDFIDEIEGNKQDISIALENESYGNMSYLQDLRANGDVFYRDSPSFMRKNWIVIEHNDSYGDLEEYFESMEIGKWEGWRYYLNETFMGFFHTPLTEEELAVEVPEYSYNKYKQAAYTSFLTFDQSQVVLDTAYGPVYRYYFLFLYYDQWGHLQGNFAPYTLIYKIPCTPNVSIFYRPKWDIYFGNRGQIGIKRDEVKTIWERDIAKVEAEALANVEDMLEFCGVGNYSDMNLGLFDQESSEDFAFSWKVYLKRQFKYNLSVSPLTEPYRDELRLLGFDINFTYDDREIDGILEDVYTYISVKATLNTSRDEYDYLDKFMAGNVGYGDTIEKKYRKEHSKEFKSDATLIVEPYLGWQDLVEDQRYYFGDPIVVPLGNNSIVVQSG